jgi:nitroimidazol reductase NimA-like FMN-containing flavoprotein (pyridoxamine 5'-phosphate oxidase superfamily)
MNVFEIPALSQEECKKIITAEYLCRIAFHGEKYPYLAPFLYVGQNNHLYFLSANYGAKIKYFRENPLVVVEIEQTVSDLSRCRFVTLYGRLQEIQDSEEKKTIRKAFVSLIQEKKLSKNIIAALGHSPEENLDALEAEGRSLVWKLIEIDRISGLQLGEETK